MIRDFTQKAVNEANAMLEEKEREVSQFQLFEYMQKEELEELHVLEYISEAEKYKNNILERHFFLKSKFYGVLSAVQEADGNYSQWFLRSKDVLDGLVQRVNQLCQMLAPEKLSMPAESYAMEMKSIREQYLNVEAVRYLLEQGITEEQLANMKSMGYQPHEIQEIWDSLVTEEDRNFYTHLMDGTKEAYEQAFAINPNDLSEHMMLVLSDYACHFLAADETGAYIHISQLELFSNALFGASYIYYQPGDVVGNSSVCYSDVYLQMLQTGTTIMLESSAFALAQMDSSHALYGEVYQRYERELSMANLWTSVQFVLGEISGTDGEAARQLAQIQGLQFEPGAETGMGGFSFRIQSGEGNERLVTSDLLRSSLELDIQHGSERLEQMRKQQGRLMEHMILEMLKGSLKITSGFIAPELGLFVSAACLAVDGSGSLSGLDSLAGTNRGKLGIRQSQNITDNMASYLSDYMKGKCNLNAAEYDEKMDMFGIGGLTIIDGEDAVTFSGMYDPDVLRKILIWEEQGPAGLMGWDGEKVEAIQNKIEIANMKEEEKVLCKAILDGKYSILTDSYKNENGESVKVDYEKFQDALQGIDSIAKKVGANAGVQMVFGK